MKFWPPMEVSWLQRLGPEFEKPYMRQLKAFLLKEKEEKQAIYPPMSQIFSAFSQTPFDSVKVVLIGQDPYHGKGQAHGLSFSVPEGVALPPSLQNIFKELSSDLGISIPKSGSLAHWARQGVLLLNATLTVRANEPRSHYGKGWELFTDAVVRLLAQRKEPLVFVLWGKAAQEKWKPIAALNDGRHLVLIAAHPSPFSAHSGFFGCRHFSQINAFLRKNGSASIEWEQHPAI